MSASVAVGAVAGLARELQLSVALPESPAVIARYVGLLLDDLLSPASRARVEPHAEAEKICRHFASRVRLAELSGAAELIALGEWFTKAIDSKDYDDGWPVCGWMHAMKCCALALENGLRDPLTCRWPAEAGSIIFGAIRGHVHWDRATQSECRTYLRNVLLAAAEIPS